MGSFKTVMKSEIGGGFVVYTIIPLIIAVLSIIFSFIACCYMCCCNPAKSYRKK